MMGRVHEREGIPLILNQKPYEPTGKFYDLTCERCGKPIKARTRGRRFCSGCSKGTYSRQPVPAELVCLGCGKKFSPKHIRDKTCPDCRWKAQHKPVSREMRQTRFKVACRYIINQGYPLAEYRRGIQVVVRHLYDVGMWDSALEIAMALEIMRRGWKAKHHYKIEKGHTVDFFFPDFGLVLEVDGHPAHFTPYGVRRDAARNLNVYNKGAWTGKALESIRITGHAIKTDIRKAGDKIEQMMKRQAREYVNEQSDKYNWLFGPKKH